MSAASSSCFLELSMGDPVENAAERDAYARARAFLTACGSRYGITSRNMDDLSKMEKRTLREVYASDPTWSKKGPCRTRLPKNLRIGRLEIALNEADAPRACENFRRLCDGAGPSKANKSKALHYLNCRFHRIQKGVLLQSGDFVRGDGSAGESVFGKKFKDEKGGLRRKHDAPGIVGMANKGKNSNTSQFYIALKPLPDLDGKYVVFGRVTNEDGLKVLARVGEEAGSDGGEPKVGVWISACGGKGRPGRGVS